MGVLSQVAFRGGQLFTTQVADVQLGAFSGKIRGYPNHGKSLVFTGVLPRSLWRNQGEIPEGLLLAKPAVSETQALFTYCMPGQRGPAIDRIYAVIEELKKITQLFPVTFLTHPETFVYRRGVKYSGYYEGVPLGDVLSAIQFGTGPIVDGLPSASYQRITERSIIEDYGTRHWGCEYRSNQALVTSYVKLLDDGKLELQIKDVTLIAGGLMVAGKEHHNREILSTMMQSISKEISAAGGFRWGLVDCGELRIVHFLSVPQLDGAQLKFLISQILDKAGLKSA